MLDDPPLPFGPWWDAMLRLVEGDRSPSVVPAALAFSHILQGGDTWEHADAALGELERQAAARLATEDHPADAAAAVMELLTDAGFRGDTQWYEDPRNSLLDRVLQRRRGLPIALSVLAIHLGRHAGVQMHGVGLPGHFVVGVDLHGRGERLFDPFHGRVLDHADATEIVQQATGRRVDWRAYLRVASSREIVLRMLRNLVMHLHRADRPEHAAAARRLLDLAAHSERDPSGSRPD